MKNGPRVTIWDWWDDMFSVDGINITAQEAVMIARLVDDGCVCNAHEAARAVEFSREFDSMMGFKK